MSEKVVTSISRSKRACTWSDKLSSQFSEGSVEEADGVNNELEDVMDGGWLTSEGDTLEEKDDFRRNKRPTTD